MRLREQPAVLQAPLREAVGPGETMMLLKVPFNTSDLEIWQKDVKDYQKDPISIAGYFRLIIKQQNPDWNDTQLLLHAIKGERNRVEEAPCGGGMCE